MVCVLSARPFLCFTRYCHQENLNLHSRDLGAGANSEVWIPQGRWREVCKALLPLASRQMLQHCPSLSFEPLSKVNPTPLVHPGTLQWVLLWPHGLPDTALVLSCQNQCGQRPCGTLESLCFGGCCPLLSTLGQACPSTCCCCSCLPQKEIGVQRADSEAGQAGGRRRGHMQANEQAEDLVCIFADVGNSS